MDESDWCIKCRREIKDDLSPGLGIIRGKHEHHYCEECYQASDETQYFGGE